MGYAGNTGVIIYWNPYQTFFIYRSYHVWFDEYYSRLSIEYIHTTDYLLLQKYPESILHNSDLLKFIPCKLDLIFTPFNYTLTITYEIYLPPSGMKTGFDLLDDEDFTIPDMSLIQYQIHHIVINFQHRLIKCVDHSYKQRRSYQISRNA